MKKIMYSVVILCLMLLFPTEILAAGAKKKSKTIDGTWQLVQMQSHQIKTDEHVPYITLSSLKKNMNGYAGCNYVHGRFELNMRKRHLHFAPIASTRMACPNAAVEQEFLELLQKVTAFSIETSSDAKEFLVFYGDKDRILLKLSRRMPLDGKWMVGRVYNMDLEKLGENVFLVFNSAEKQMHGYLGCNSYSASLEYNAQKESLIKIGEGMKTLRMCDSMDVEQKMERALSEIVSYKKFSERKAILCNAGGKVLIELVR